jgi:hypothetical protein
MSHTNCGSQIDIQRINNLVERHAGGTGTRLPRGTHTGRVVHAGPYVASRGRQATRAILEVTDGRHTGKQIPVVLDDRWHAAQLVREAAVSGRRLVFDVFVRRSGDGKQIPGVNFQTIRRAEGPPAEAAATLPARVPTAEEIAAAAAAYPHGFACIGAKEARRDVVAWETAYASMAGCTAKVIGQPVFLSNFSFGDDFLTYVRNHEKPGSMAGYRGPAYSRLLVFDIDRKDASGRPDPAAALPDVSSLIVALMELGFPHESISVFFSGSKGAHVAVASSLVGAMPSDNFPAIAREFCSMIAAEAGIEIDLSLYSILQPLRAPNSRHEGSGLFKVAMTVEEFLDRSLEEIRELATRPRVFVPPPFVHEPIPVLAELWSHAGQVVSGPARRRDLDQRAIGGDARIFGQTWEFLFGGAPEGERAVALFRAAANLADFESCDDLIRALLSRGTMLCGLPPAEAAAHIDSALRRAAEGRPA